MEIQIERASVTPETRDAIERGVGLLVPDHDAVRVLVTGDFERAARRELAGTRRPGPSSPIESAA